VAVEAFLQGEIAFLAIPAVIRATLERHRSEPLSHLDEAIRADRWGRSEARRIIDSTP
jgi:1-deoxy-D-xylulose-5-phosphate reductoisomerase